MNKHELIKELASSLNISQILCQKVLAVFLENIILLMEQGNKYNQTGFGTFRTEIVNKRISFNPALKKTMLLPKKRKMKFKASAKLKEFINE